MSETLFDLGLYSFCCLFMAIAQNYTLTPKYPRKISIPFYIFINILINYIFHYSALIISLLPSFHLRSNIKMVFCFGFWIFYIFSNFSNPVKEKILALFTLIITFSLTEICSSGIVLLILEIPAEDLRNLSGFNKLFYFGFGIFSYALASGLSYIILKKKKKIKLQKSVLLVFSLIIICFAALTFLLANSTLFTENKITHIILMLSPIPLLLLFAALYWLMRRLSEQEVLREKLYWSENLKALELDYYTDLQRKFDEIRKIRHDFKDHTESIQLLLEENTPESIKWATDILMSLNKSIDATKIPLYTENIIVNTIVSIKADEAKRNGIDFQAALDLPKELNIESIDLNCVFLNLLNNAVESCRRMPEDTQKSIKLKSCVRAGYLMIKTENPYLDFQTDEKGKFKTTKSDKASHGLGLALIQDIAEKYDGTFETKTENEQFTALVTLRILPK
ncbi:MAG: sensor histidine kinase [Candidatus Fimenecus sp.]